MTIVDLLKTSGTRLSSSDVWMYYDEVSGRWVVLMHLYRKRVPISVIETESESKAVAAFCGAAGIEVTE